MGSEFKCKICGNDQQNHSFIATDKLLGIEGEFIYFECSVCKCVQIQEIPHDLEKYYPHDYYSYQEPTFPTRLNPFLYFLKKRLAAFYIGKFSFTGWLLSFFFEHPFPWLKSNIVDFNTKILDVGCGSGRKLLSMQRSGFKNLIGIDPFNAADIFYEKGLKVLKKDLFEITEKYEFIMLHHSFEHMGSPKDVLLKLAEILEDNGCILIRVPVANSYAWRKYQAHWYALDAPRHLFLHTTLSMQKLAESTGLKITSLDYDSVLSQFIFSEAYQRNLPFTEGYNLFSKKEIRRFSKEVGRLNDTHDGDTACFILKKKD